MTLEYQVLRVSERMGMRPAEVESLPPRQLARLIAYDEIRRAEER